MDFILALSVSEERSLLPSFFESEAGEISLLSDFEQYYRSSALCGVDTKKVLDDPVWRAFLSTMTIENLG